MVLLRCKLWHSLRRFSLETKKRKFPRKEVKSRKIWFGGVPRALIAAAQDESDGKSLVKEKSFDG